MFGFIGSIIPYWKVMNRGCPKCLQNSKITFQTFRATGFESFFQFFSAKFPVHLFEKPPKDMIRIKSNRSEYFMSERRQETRRRFSAFTPVYDLVPRTLLGYLGD